MLLGGGVTVLHFRYHPELVLGERERAADIDYQYSVRKSPRDSAAGADYFAVMDRLARHVRTVVGLLGLPLLLAWLKFYRDPDAREAMLINTGKVMRP